MESDYIENYEPAVNEIVETPTVEYHEPVELSDEEIAEKMEESQWQMMKEQVFNKNTIQDRF